MKLTPSHYYLVLLVTTVLAIIGISLMYFLPNMQESPISKATSNITTPLVKKDDTLLALQVNNDSGCDSAGLLLTEAQILALPQHEFTTTHTWSDVPQTFRGPLLEDVLNLVCTNTHSILLRALNDYDVTVNFDSTKKYQPVLAHSTDGKRMSIRDKGPLWIMVDYEHYKIPRKNLESMMVWQLSDITIISINEKH